VFLKAHIARLCSSAIVWSYATTFLRFGGVLLVLPVVLRSVPTAELGLFYFFQTLNVVTSLIDAGVGPTVYRSVSYAFAGAQSLKEKGYEVETTKEEASPNAGLLARIVGTYSRFYLLGAGVLLFVFLVICSPFVWHLTEQINNPASGRGVWILLAGAGAFNFAGSLWNSVLAGLNRIREQQRVQLVSIAIGYLVTIVALLLGWGLWALAVSTVIQAFLSRELARRISHSYLFYLGVDLKKLSFDSGLFATLWPSAWRSGLVSAGVSAYLSIPVFYTSSFTNLDQAASVGLAMQIALTVGQVASVVILVKGPLFGILRVSGEIGKLHKIFYQRLVIATFLSLAGSIGVLMMGNWFIHDLIRSKTHLPSLGVLALILLFVALDNLQANFRGLAISANQMGFWKIIAFGGGGVVVASFFALKSGMLLFFCVLILVKLIIIDLPIVAFGAKTLCP